MPCKVRCLIFSLVLINLNLIKIKASHEIFPFLALHLYARAMGKMDKTSLLQAIQMEALLYISVFQTFCFVGTAKKLKKFRDTIATSIYSC